MEMTEFEKIAKNREGMGVRRGRPSTLSAVEKAERKVVQNAKNRLRNEARRRAHIVLQYRYSAEFQQLLQQELDNLSKNDPRYSNISHSSNTTVSDFNI
jgi:putative IMPACT (imprinted ancient) family translation regulator